MNYDNIKESLNTGDIILFSNTSTILSKIISLFSESIYTHAAMVIRNPKFLGHDLPDDIYIIESTGLEHVKDVEDNEYKFGVQLRLFKEVYDSYNGTLYWRQLMCTKNDEFYKNLKYAHSIVHNRVYDVNPIDWIKSCFDIEIGNVQKKKTFFCSALVAFLCVSLNILDKNTPWTIVRPKDLGTEGGHRSNIKFTNCILNKEKQIK